MTKKLETLVPKTVINVEYITLGGLKLLKVEPDGDKVRIGQETHFVKKDDIWSDKRGKRWCRIVQGNPQAVPVWVANQSKITATQVDATANNNLLEQFWSIAKGGKTPPINWVIIGALGILALLMVGVAVNQNGSIKSLDGKLTALEAAMGLGADGRPVPACTPTAQHPCDQTTQGRSAGGLYGTPGQPSTTGG